MKNPSNLRLPFCRSLFFGTLLCALPSTGADARSPEQIPTLGYALHRLGPLGSNGWGQTDVDGDGRADLVTGSDGAAAMILVFGAMEQSSLLGMKQSLFNPPGSIAALATASAGATRVVTVSPGGLATRYGGWPLGPLGSFNVATGTRVARIADIDADGTLELVCAGPGQIGAYTLSSGESEWTLPLSVADLAIEQLDADPALELIIAGGDTNPAYVVDGATRTLEWSRPEGIGTFVAAGRLGNFLEPVIVGARAWGSLSGFSVAPFGLTWTMTNFNTDAVTTGDADGDGRDEFAVGDGQWGSIRVYDGPSRQLRHQIGNSGHGVWALAMVDFNADARDEVFYSARIEASSNRDANFAAAIVDPITSRVRLTIESYWQGATATALADLDGNGSLEWVVGTSHPFANKGLLRKFDAATGAEIWRAPYESANSFLPFQMGYNGLHVAQLDADAPMELPD